MQLSSFCPFQWKKTPCLKRNVSYQCDSTIQLRNTLGGCSIVAFQKKEKPQKKGVALIHTWSPTK